ncbi:hypothetical protein [Rhizobium sp. L51/94]|uniref:hypothetical protein n=1 Tax=Rhizobium sp. L51/94 TaxID=2819999 RepID=UPI001C5BA3FB|nr:hypothetical protein [Rhizobium sp. L51/94]QXZ80945.1 hypothetical protein J5274_18670 [Rhizobium sp. L51/94]
MVNYRLTTGAFKGALICVIASISSTPAFADTVTDAFFMCKVVDGTGLATAPCEVSGWKQTVTASLDMSSEDARQACKMLTDLAQKYNKHFEEGNWTIQIKSPYSGDNSTAYCNLPK